MISVKIGNLSDIMNFLSIRLIKNKVRNPECVCRITALLPAETHGNFSNNPLIEKYKRK